MSKLTVVNSATPAQKARPDYTKFDRLQEFADHILKVRSDLQRQYGWLPEPKRRVEEIDRHLAALQQANKFLEILHTFNDQSQYDSPKGTIKREVIKKHIAVLLDSFPTSNVPNLPVFITMLVEEILAVRPKATVIGLEATCREIRRTMKFVPTISEVLTILKQQEAVWRVRYDAMSGIQSTFSEVQEMRQQFALQAEAADAAEAQWQARLKEHADWVIEAEDIPF